MSKTKYVQCWPQLQPQLAIAATTVTAAAQPRTASAAVMAQPQRKAAITEMQHQLLADEQEAERQRADVAEKEAAIARQKAEMKGELQAQKEVLEAEMVPHDERGFFHHGWTTMIGLPDRTNLMEIKERVTVFLEREFEDSLTPNLYSRIPCI